MDLRRARRRLFVLSLLWWRRAWFSFRRGPGGECGAAKGKDDFREGQESKPDGFRRELIGGGFFLALISGFFWWSRTYRSKNISGNFDSYNNFFPSANYMSSFFKGGFFLVASIKGKKVREPK